MTFDLETGKVVARRRLKSRQRALGLAVVPASAVSEVTAVGVLWQSSDIDFGLSVFNPASGKRLGSVRLRGLRRPRDLTFVPTDRETWGWLAILGDAACGSRPERLQTAVTLWSAESGQRAGCYPVE